MKDLASSMMLCTYIDLHECFKFLKMHKVQTTITYIHLKSQDTNVNKHHTYKFHKSTWYGVHFAHGSWLLCVECKVALFQHTSWTWKGIGSQIEDKWIVTKRVMDWYRVPNFMWILIKQILKCARWRWIGSVCELKKYSNNTWKAICMPWHSFAIIINIIVPLASYCFALQFWSSNKKSQGHSVRVGVVYIM